jgi:hypothetical protein
MSEQSTSNGFLYFAVGGLLVAVLTLGYFYTKDSDPGDLTVIETAAGDESEGPDFSLEMSEDSFKATSDSDE